MFLLKLFISNLIIVACVLISKRYPTLGGLIATMPLTSLIVLIWLFSDAPADTVRISDYLRGVLWGIWPTIAFFAAALICLRRGLSVPAALVAGAACWLAGALLHTMFIRT
jgi:uncharacterized membrane protein (GlpM family)